MAAMALVLGCRRPVDHVLVGPLRRWAATTAAAAAAAAATEAEADLAAAAAAAAAAGGWAARVSLPTALAGVLSPSFPYPVSAASRAQLVRASRAALPSALLEGALARLDGGAHPEVILLTSPLAHSDRLLAALAHGVAAELRVPLLAVRPEDLDTPTPASRAGTARGTLPPWSSPSSVSSSSTTARQEARASAAGLAQLTARRPPSGADPDPLAAAHALRDVGTALKQVRPRPCACPHT
jgi:hypothetical protein